MMAKQLPPCPGCDGEPFVDQPYDEPFRYLECNECSFRAEENDWNRRVPGPATKAMLERAKLILSLYPSGNSEWGDLAKNFLAEWPDPATPRTPEPEQPATPWKCAICGEPVRIAGDLTVWHYAGTTNHDAELSSEDRKTLANDLRLSD